MTPILLRLVAATAAPLLPNPAVVPCAADARDQALKLLRFHVDGDDRAAIDPASVRVVGTVAPLVGKRRFDVIEVSGYVYKGSYRMRLIYARLDGRCVLMGQGIFERSDL